MADDSEKTGAEPRSAWPAILSWVGRATALIGLFGSIAGGVTWFVNHHRQHAELDGKMATARAQADQGEYQGSVQSYAEILKSNPLYAPALDQQLDTAMQWVENFHGSAPDAGGASSTEQLDQIMPILDAGLARSKGPRAADVLAHIGWAHWLNQHVAEREFGPVAEEDLRKAIALDPDNAYANAMLANWMLQNGGSYDEATQRFNAAVSSRQARPFVRRLQFGALIGLDKKGARAETVKAADDMRRSQEVLDEETKSGVLGYCFDPGVTSRDEMHESLTAVPADDAWQTYLWLDDRAQPSHGQTLRRDFIQANLLELSGKRDEALMKYRPLQQELKTNPGPMQSSVNEAVARLAHR